MKITRGTVVETEFGVGPVIAITKDWLVHEDEQGREICVYLPDNRVSIPAEIEGIDVPDNDLEVSA